MRKLSLVFLLLATLLLHVPAASAAIINSADVNGLRTFQDLKTGRVWLDLNNFFNQTFNEMAAISSSAGFTIANRSDVTDLLDSLSNPAANWGTYANIMGKAPNRDLIWGAYLTNPGDTSHQWAWGCPFTGWNFASGWSNDRVPNFGLPCADLNLWAYQEAYLPVPEASLPVPESFLPVPEPSTIILLGAGLIGAGFFRRLRRS